MRLPQKPPPIRELLSKIWEQEGGTQRWLDLMLLPSAIRPFNPYLHWDQLRYRSPPEGLTTTDWWLAIKTARNATMRRLPFVDKHGTPFAWTLPDHVLNMLTKIDRDSGGAIQTPELVATGQNRDRFLVTSLMEEAITSSQLEGAATTYGVAKDMLREGRKPITNDERMIVNNFTAMQFIRENRQTPLTPDLILELQAILTTGTLEDATASGRWRREDEDIKVVDRRDETILHVPPNAPEIPERLARLCKFANDNRTDPYIPPVIRAIVIHFMLAYDHPFVDGNGRTARALFYWSVANQGYWPLEFISISTILRRAPSKYARAYLYSESDDNDLTYFIDYQLKVISRAILSLYKYLAEKAEEVRIVERSFIHSPEIRALLNHRQLALISHALKHPAHRYTVASHQKSHGVTYETARTDLHALVAHNVLDRQKVGRTFVFVAPRDLRDRLDAMNRDRA